MFVTNTIDRQVVRNLYLYIRGYKTQRYAGFNITIVAIFDAGQSMLRFHNKFKKKQQSEISEFHKLNVHINCLTYLTVYNDKPFISQQILTIKDKSIALMYAMYIVNCTKF